MKLRTVSLIFHDIMIVSDTFSSMFTTFLKPSWRLFWFYRKYGKLSQVLVTDDIIDILTNQFRVKRAHHRERLWKVSEYEKIENVKIHLFCIIQLYLRCIVWKYKYIDKICFARSRWNQVSLSLLSKTMFIWDESYFYDRYCKIFTK